MDRSRSSSSRRTPSGPLFSWHNHSPAITECPNGDLLAVWYSCVDEAGTELNNLASRLRRGATEWEPASLFWDGADVNDHAPKLWWDGEQDALSTSPAVLTRTSCAPRTDNGVTWSKAQVIQPVSEIGNGIIRTREGTILMTQDATTTSLTISRDGGKTWTSDVITDKKHAHRSGSPARHAGIHAPIVELNDGRLMTFGRLNTEAEQAKFDFKTPASFSSDGGKTWTHEPTEFPAISSVQRAVLMRLQRRSAAASAPSPISPPTAKTPKGMTFKSEDGEFNGAGLFAAALVRRRQDLAAPTPRHPRRQRAHRQRHRPRPVQAQRHPRRAPRLPRRHPDPRRPHPAHQQQESLRLQSRVAETSAARAPMTVDRNPRLMKRPFAFRRCVIALPLGLLLTVCPAQPHLPAGLKALPSSAEQGRGPLALVNLNHHVLGSADVFGGKQPDLFVAGYGGPQAVHLFKWVDTAETGAPVFAQPVQVKCAFKDKGTVIQSKDGSVHGLWIDGDELVLTLFDRDKVEFRETRRVALDKKIKSPASLAALANADGSLDLAFEIGEGTREPKGDPWTEEWRPYNSTGIAAGELRYRHLVGARLPSLLQGLALGSAADHGHPTRGLFFDARHFDGESRRGS